MFDRTINHRAADRQPVASVARYLVTGTSGASLSPGVVVANSGAAAERRFYKLCKNSSSVAVSGRESRAAGLWFESLVSVAYGRATYNYALETDGMRPVALRAPAAAAQRGRYTS